MRQANEKISIDSFKLDLPCCDSQLILHVNEWLKTLSRCSIKEVSLSIFFLNHLRGYSFPKEILSSASLTKLELKGCKFELSKDCVEIKLVSLKWLSFCHVVVSDDLIEQLIKSCTSLENLRLRRCEGFSSLEVEGLLHLKNLSLILNRNLRRVKIDEPSLLFLDYNGGYIKHDDIEFSNCRNLRTLSLAHCGITGEQLSEQLLALANLMDLSIIFCREITSLNISRGRLMKLYVEHGEELSVVDIVTPNLRSFRLASIYLSSSSSKTLSLSLHAPPTLKVDYYLVSRVLGPTMFIELLKFLSTLDASRLTFTTGIQSSIIPQAWRKQFSRMKSLAQFQKFWIDPKARLSDVLRDICLVIQKKRSMVKILKDEPIEANDDEE